MAENEKKAVEAAAQPLPIWFFVGLILLVYGVLVLAGAAFGKSHPTVLAEIKPGLWWGAIITVVGAVFLAIGIKVREK
jgi:uncharacterized membrane protein